MEKTKTSKALKQALLDLFHADEAHVMKALATIKKEGGAKEIAPLMELYVTQSEGPIKEELGKMLSSMKLDGGDTALVQLLSEERFRSEHTFILTCIWNSGYQPVEHLDVIVDVALEGDYMTAFEVLTILENLEPPFDMDVMAVASLNVDDYLEENKGHQRDTIILQIQSILDRYKSGVSADSSEEG